LGVRECEVVDGGQGICIGGHAVASGGEWAVDRGSRRIGYVRWWAVSTTRPRRPLSRYSSRPRVASVDRQGGWVRQRVWATCQPCLGDRTAYAVARAPSRNCVAHAWQVTGGSPGPEICK
jgi:hypothetical protein